MRALWYFQINLLWDKGTLILEPVDAGYRPKDATEAEIWAQVEKIYFTLQKICQIVGMQRIWDVPLVEQLKHYLESIHATAFV